MKIWAAAVNLYRRHPIFKPKKEVVTALLLLLGESCVVAAMWEGYGRCDCKRKMERSLKGRLLLGDGAHQILAKSKDLGGVLLVVGLLLLEGLSQQLDALDMSLG